MLREYSIVGIVATKRAEKRFRPRRREYSARDFTLLKPAPPLWDPKRGDRQEKDIGIAAQARVAAEKELSGGQGCDHISWA